MKKITRGKVRDIYELDDGNLLIVTTDRASAFDVVLPDEIPYKGVVLNRLSQFWFEMTRDIVPNHLLTTDNSKMPVEFQNEEYEGRCMLVRKLRMVPIECIVRGFIVGSGWESYQKNRTICGIEFLPGLQEAEKIDPIYTPTTKATEGHDQHINFEQTVELLGGNRDLAKQIRDKSLEIFKRCSSYALTKNIIIADTKLEYGLDENGDLVLGDELMTPDSSRFWPADKYRLGVSPPSLDKQFLRDWLKASGWNKEPPAPHIPKGIIFETASRYFKIYQTLTGEVF